MTKTVYVIGIPGGLYKIGMISNLEQRLTSLSTSMPFELEVIHTIDSKYASQIEKELHEEFSDSWIRREWYELTEEQIDYIKAFEYHPHPKPRMQHLPRIRPIARQRSIQEKDYQRMEAQHSPKPQPASNNLKFKTVQCLLNGQDPLTVELDGVLPSTHLTPKLARRAAHVAQGTSWPATVWDWEDDHNGVGYRLYKRSHRKLYCVDGNVYAKS